METASFLGIVRCQNRAELQGNACSLGKIFSGFFQSRDSPVSIKGNDSRANVDGADMANGAVFAQRELGRASANIDIEHALAGSAGKSDRARTKRRQSGFQAVPGADHDKFAGLRRKDLADGACIAAAHRYTGKNERTRVYVLGLQASGCILGREKRCQGIGIDSIITAIGREQNVGLMQERTFDHHIAGIESLQHNA